MLILPDLTIPDIIAKPDLKSLFSGPLKIFFPDLVTLTFQLNYVIVFISNFYSSFDIYQN